MAKLEMDLLTYLLIQDPNAKTKKRLGEINFIEGISTIKLNSESEIEVWCKKEQNRNNGYGSVTMIAYVTEKFQVYKLNTLTGEIIEEREEVIKPTENRKNSGR